LTKLSINLWAYNTEGKGVSLLLDKNTSFVLEEIDDNNTYISIDCLVSKYTIGKYISEVIDSINEQKENIIINEIYLKGKDNG